MDDSQSEKQGSASVKYTSLVEAKAVREVPLSFQVKQTFKGWLPGRYRARAVLAVTAAVTPAMAEADQAVHANPYDPSRGSPAAPGLEISLAGVNQQMNPTVTEASPPLEQQEGMVSGSVLYHFDGEQSNDLDEEPESQPPEPEATSLEDESSTQASHYLPEEAKERLRQQITRSLQDDRQVVVPKPVPAAPENQAVSTREGDKTIGQIRQELHQAGYPDWASADAKQLLEVYNNMLPDFGRKLSDDELKRHNIFVFRAKEIDLGFTGRALEEELLLREAWQLAEETRTDAASPKLRVNIVLVDDDHLQPNSPVPDEMKADYQQNLKGADCDRCEIWGLMNYRWVYWNSPYGNIRNLKTGEVQTGKDALHYTVTIYVSVGGRNRPRSDQSFSDISKLTKLSESQAFDLKTLSDAGRWYIPDKLPNPAFVLRHELEHGDNFAGNILKYNAQQGFIGSGQQGEIKVDIASARALLTRSKKKLSGIYFRTPQGKVYTRENLELTV